MSHTETSDRKRARGLRWTATIVTTVLLSLAGVAGAENQEQLEAQKQLQSICSKLENPKNLALMDGLLHHLIKKCDRQDLLGTVRSEGAEEGVPGSAPSATDAAVSDPTGDTPAASHTQSETSMAYNPNTGTLCSAYNDSQHGIPEGLGFSGFSRSTDGGLTWDDRGNVSNDDGGDPSLTWRHVDGKFYYTALRNGGLGFYRSDDDCQSFTFVSQLSNTGNDDKELTAVDNNPASPFYGRFYVAWTDFSDSRITVRRSADAGATWSAPVKVSGVGLDVQGAWPAVAPNGDVFVAWIHWMGAGFPNGNLEVQVVRSTDGGVTFSPVTPPATNVVNPRDSASSATCGRPALKGNIRYLPSPTIVVGGDGVLHAVYGYDPDGFNTGDVINVYYRRSTDSGATWGTEVQVNDVATNDQYQPSMSVSSGNIVTVGWYDRRNDVANTLVEYFGRRSFDGGVTWSEPATLLSDVASPIFLDPSLAGCYHGDYDTQVTSAAAAHLQWSDDRRIQGGHNDPDIFGENMAVGTDFLVLPTPNAISVCSPTAANFTVDVPQFLAFAESVTLSATGNPGGSTVSFGTNPVTPPGSSTMGVTTAGVSAGTSTITVTGTSSPSNIVHTGDVSLTVFTANPSAPTLTVPADNAVNVAVPTNFGWSAATQSESYTLEVATDSAFTNIVATQTGISGTTASVSGLNTNTEYFWRVRSTNTCGTGDNSSVFSFTTIPAPGDCAVGVTPAVGFQEDFEGTTLPTGWTSSGTGNSWASSTVRFHNGARSFRATGPVVVSDQRLDSTSIVLPSASEAPISLIFWNHQTIEDDPPNECFDGAVIEVSTDGGTIYTRLESEIQVLPYDNPVDNGFANPIAGTEAWCGDPRDWSKVIVDLTAFAGQTVKIRFRLATDNSVGREGWYVDEMTVQSCPTPPVFDDGFETGDVGAWSLCVGAGCPP